MLNLHHIYTGAETKIKVLLNVREKKDRMLVLCGYIYNFQLETDIKINYQIEKYE